MNRPTPPGYRRWLLALLAAVYTCAFIDRIIIAILGPAIMRDLGLSDVEFGLLGGMAFALFYTTLGVPIAWLAERRSRTTIIAVAVAVWSAMTMLCGVARTFGQLLLCRVGVGIGEAGCTPPAHSLISDHYPPGARSSALAIYSIGVPLGATIGAVAGGWLAQTFDWRTAFVVVGAPGLVLALLVKLTLREPVRGQSDGLASVPPAPPFRTVLQRLMRTPTLRHVCAACSLTTLAAHGINLFAPTYFVRRFDLGLAEVGLIFGLVTGAAGAIGILLGGFGVGLGARRDVRWYVWASAVGVALAFPFYLAAYSLGSVAAAMTALLMGATGMSIYFAPSFALVHNLVEPRMRASMSALLLLSMNVLGQGLGPLMMGFISDMTAAGVFAGTDYRIACQGGSIADAVAAACADAAMRGLQWSILVTAVFFLWGAVHFAIAGRSVARDAG